MKKYFVYILTNRWHTVFYTGVTDDLMRRIFEHKMQLMEGFTQRYNVYKLVYFEEILDGQTALHREKIIKKWKRAFKIEAISRMNPEWGDLYSPTMETPQQVRGHS